MIRPSSPPTFPSLAGFPRHPAVLATASALLALSACSSDDDDALPSGEEAGDQTSEPAPDVDAGDREVSSEPSGDDTGAIAGLWNAASGTEPRVDQRYVLISGNGLWTDYDFRQDAFGDEGNCYFVTPLKLDLELGEAVGDGVALTELALDPDEVGAHATSLPQRHAPHRRRRAVLELDLPGTFRSEARQPSEA